MKDLIGRARRVAAHSVPVILEGESGTGKELFARAIHRSSARRDQRFVAVNCGAIPAELLESELFGHVKGSFSGAIEAREGHFKAAHGGTLFLDEIGELPLPMQVKLLRPLQEEEILPVGASTVQSVDVRVIAATNRKLIEEVRTGRFREDLFYRLAVAVLRVPSLRERLEDIDGLADHFIAKINEQTPGLEARHVTEQGRGELRAHGWPGNVRELVNTLRRAVVWSGQAQLGAREIREAILSAGPEPSGELLDRPLGHGFKLQTLIDELERRYIARALRISGDNRTAAARLLGFASRQVLENHIRRVGLSTPED